MPIYKILRAQGVKLGSNSLQPPQPTNHVPTVALPCTTPRMFFLMAHVRRYGGDDHVQFTQTDPYSTKYPYHLFYDFHPAQAMSLIVLHIILPSTYNEALNLLLIIFPNLHGLHIMDPENPIDAFHAVNRLNAADNLNNTERGVFLELFREPDNCFPEVMAQKMIERAKTGVDGIQKNKVFGRKRMGRFINDYRKRNKEEEKLEDENAEKTQAKKNREKEGANKV